MKGSSMNNEQFLLNKLGEEGKEVGLVTSKSMQFGLDSNDNGNLPKTNKEHLFQELNDFMATIELLNEECGLGFTPCREAINAKKEKIKKYREISKQLGHTQ